MMVNENVYMLPFMLRTHYVCDHCLVKDATFNHFIHFILPKYPSPWEISMASLNKVRKRSKFDLNCNHISIEPWFCSLSDLGNYFRRICALDERKRLKHQSLQREIISGLHFIQL